MRKLAGGLIVSAALTAGFGNVAYAAQPLQMVFYDSVSWPGPLYSCNGTASGGKGTWFTYWQNCPSGGCFETNRSEPGNPTPHPCSFDLLDGNILGDEGLLTSGATSYIHGMDPTSYTDTINEIPKAIVDVLVFAIAYACKAGDCSTLTGDTTAWQITLPRQTLPCISSTAPPHLSQTQI
jgi:hypothetical protein